MTTMDSITPGLLNIGNTCFLNACLQVANHIYELNDIYNKFPVYQTNPTLYESSVFNGWIELHRQLWTVNHHRPLNPSSLVGSIQQYAKHKGFDLFVNNSPNDIHEFIILFFDAIHTSIARKIYISPALVSSRWTPYCGSESGDAAGLITKKCYDLISDLYKKEYSEVIDIFYGMYLTTLSSISTSSQQQDVLSFTPEMFFILDLPIPNPQGRGRGVGGGVPITIYDCLDLFVKEEHLEGDNAWWNEESNRKENVTKNIYLYNLPPILVISLNRFSPCGNYKINDLVEYPFQLNLTPYCHPSIISERVESAPVYNLFGICNHISNQKGHGHYTAFVCNYLNEWIHYNDEMIEINFHPSKVVSPYAYCLFYRKI